MQQEKIILHTKEDFEGMKKAGIFAADILDYLEEFIVEGQNTAKINELAHEKIVSAGHIPAPLNYKGFPKSICTSINHVICHGIPSEKDILKNGDIINVDVTAIVDGWHGDTSRMFIIGNASQKAKRLCRITKECLMKSIEIVKPGVKIKEIGKIIQEHAENNGFSVIRDFCGHGLGRTFHCRPTITHYYSTIPDGEVRLEEGMFFTIEPMINIGTYKCKILDDDWTAVTRDGKLSAQYEHSIGVTSDGYEIFTKSSKGVV